MVTISFLKRCCYDKWTSATFSFNPILWYRDSMSSFDYPLQTQFPHLKHGDTENQLAGVVIRIKWVEGVRHLSQSLHEERVILKKRKIVQREGDCYRSSCLHLNYRLPHLRCSSRVSIDTHEGSYNEHAHLRVDALITLRLGSAGRWWAEPEGSDFREARPRMQPDHSDPPLLWALLLCSRARSTGGNQQLMTAKKWINSSIPLCTAA